MIYCIDTSAWMDGWERDYPKDVFPTLWEALETHIETGAIKATEEVYVEVSKKDDALHAWFKDRKEIFVPVEEAVQDIVADILSQHSRLVDTKKNRSQADPFVIATAEHLKATVVTGERPSGKIDKPRIPDVCQARRLRCISFLEMLRELEWKF